MGIISFSRFSRFLRFPVRALLLAPLQAWSARFDPAQQASQVYPKPGGAPRPSGRLILRFRSNASTAPATPLTDQVVATEAAEFGIGSLRCKAVSARVRPVASRLKVLREFDAALSPALAGRMVIFGRMTDVCAELERMTQRHAAEI